MHKVSNFFTPLPIFADKYTHTHTHTHTHIYGSSAGNKSTSNAGDPDSIPGLGQSAGEGIAYSL